MKKATQKNMLKYHVKNILNLIWILFLILDK